MQNRHNSKQGRKQTCTKPFWLYEPPRRKRIFPRIFGGKSRRANFVHEKPWPGGWYNPNLHSLRAHRQSTSFSRCNNTGGRHRREETQAYAIESPRIIQGGVRSFATSLSPEQDRCVPTIPIGHNARGHTGLASHATPSCTSVAVMSCFVLQRRTSLGVAWPPCRRPSLSTLFPGSVSPREILS